MSSDDVSSLELLENRINQLEEGIEALEESAKNDLHDDSTNLPQITQRIATKLDTVYATLEKKPVFREFINANEIEREEMRETERILGSAEANEQLIQSIAIEKANDIIEKAKRKEGELESSLG